jgi:deazaflavin-dependent oxidoreductase (nitroreductase family)
MDIKEINRKTIEHFRAGEEIPGMHRERLVLLTTTGAKSGRPHTAPMMFIDDGDRLLVIASNMGAPKTPDWYNNLIVDSTVQVEVGTESYRAVATALTGEEYESSWASIKDNYPFFADHEKQAGRVIPVVALTRT